MGNKEIFDRTAKQYNTSERIEVAKIVADSIRKHIVDGKEKTAVDFGCGTGLVGFELINEFKSVLFLDASQNMIELVKTELVTKGVKNADALCVDLETGQQLEINADYIIAVQVMLHINDVDDIISKLYSLLNKDGHLIIVDFDKNDAVSSELVHNGFVQNEMVDRFRQIGFKEIENETFYYGKNIFMNEDASLFIIDGKK